MHYWGYKRASKGEKIYNNTLILLLAVACVGLCLLSSLLYFSIVIRYALVGVALIVAIWKHKTILGALKKKKKAPVQTAERADRTEIAEELPAETGKEE